MSRSNNTIFSYGPHNGKELSGEEIVRWRIISQPFGLKSVKVYSYTGDSPSGYIEGMHPSIKFSPDSRRLAVLAHGILSCIDLETARLWPLAPPDERVTTFSWIGPDEIAYVGRPHNREFFRHKIDAPPDTREVIHAGAGPALQGIFFPNEHWSPRGRFVVYKLLGRGFELLEVHTGLVRSFEASPTPLLQVSWKPDESAVLCVSCDENRSPRAAVLIDLRTGESLDLSEQYASAFSDPRRTELDPAWTPDGKYFIVNTWSGGGFLVQPNPWRIIPVGERLVGVLGGRFSPDRGNEPPRNPPPSVHSFPVAGWIKVLAGGKEYAVDYALEHYVRLGGWASQRNFPKIVSSPKGDRTFELAPFGGIKVRSLDLAAADLLQRPAASNRRRRGTPSSGR